MTTNNLALFYRRSLLEKAGIAQPPATWQELEEQSQKNQGSLGNLRVCLLC
ncbi:MAG: extracellular solute-binding protein [Candidatus Caldatribacteriaceae bacterium]